MAFEAPPMETLLSSFFNISPTDSFVRLFIKIYCNQQDLGRKGERGGERECVCGGGGGRTERGQKRRKIRGRKGEERANKNKEREKLQHEKKKSPGGKQKHPPAPAHKRFIIKKKKRKTEDQRS